MSHIDQTAGRRAGRILILFSFLYFFVVLQAFQGNTWHRIDSIASDQAQKPSGEKWFQSFDGSDWTLFGLTALADFADLDSSYSLNLHEMSVYNSGLRAWPTPCPGGLVGTCYFTNRKIPYGEGNPLITGLFGTRYPTALDYTAWGVLELAVQAGIAWALPEKWRTGAFGVFIGIGVADTIVNAYGGGVTFRF